MAFVDAKGRSVICSNMDPKGLAELVVIGSEFAIRQR